MISLPDWCARHTLKEFFELMSEDLSGFPDGLNAENSSDDSHGKSVTNSHATEANGERHSLRS